MVRKNKDYFSISPRNGKIGRWMLAMIFLIAGISMPSMPSAAATPFLPAEDKGISTVQNSISSPNDSESSTSIQSSANYDSIKNKIQTAKDGKSIPDTLKVIQGEGCDYDPPYWSAQKPFRGQPNVPISQNTFEFMLRDDRSGVDLRTFHLIVDGIHIYANSIGLTLIGNPQKYSVQYKLPTNKKFFWGDTIWIKLSVCDLNDPPNCMADSMFFVMEADLDSPIILPAGPYPGDIAPVNSAIKLAVSDTKSGIDFSSFKIYLNGINYSDSVLILKDQIPNIIINSKRQNIFEYNQQVEVIAEVSDLIGNKADTTYYFTIEREHFPPFIEFIYPDRNSTKLLAINDSLVFQIKDQHSQIDTSQTIIILKLNNKNTNFLISSISSTSDEKVFTYTIRPIQLFQFNMAGQLRVQGVDKSGNAGIDSISFKIAEDYNGPEIIVIKPQVDEANVELEHIVEFEIKDDLAGVDRNSIKVMVNDIDQSSSLTIRELERSAKRYQVLLSNTAYWNDTITVKIIARDLAYPGNKNELTYQYFIKRDDDGPQITIISPLSEQKDVTFNHVIEFEVEDKLAGVNSNSIRVTVNGVDRTGSLTINEMERLSKKYRVILSNTGFWNDTIGVKIVSFDLSQPPNRSELIYQFYIEKDLEGPLVIADYPKPGQQNIKPKNVRIQFKLEDSSAGLDLSSLKFYVKDKAVPVSDLRPLDKDEKEEDRTNYNIGYSYPAGNFNLGEKVRVRVNVFDEAKNPARGDTDYTFTITRDPYPPKIRIIQPLADEKNVNRYLPVILEVTDLETGINTNSIILKINNQLVQPSISSNSTNRAAPQLNSDTSFRVKYTPTSPYTWNSTNTIFISVEDSVGQMDSLSYKFSAQEDLIGPKFVDLSPDLNAKDIISNSSIFVGIKDTLSGVNIESFILLVNGILIPKEAIAVVEKKYNPDELEHNQKVPSYYRIKFSPSSRFGSGKFIQIQLEAKDLAGNKSNFGYSFTVFKDTTSPIIKLIQPQPLDSVDRRPVVEFDAIDPESGINSPLTELWVNGKKISINPTQSSGDTLIHVLTESFGPFNFGEQIPFKIVVVNNDGLITKLEDIFHIVQDMTPPIIKLIQPGNRASVKTPVIFQMIDNETGINLTRSSFEIDRCIDGKIIVPSITQQMIEQLALIKQNLNGSGYEIIFNSQGIRRFAYFEKVKIRIKTENAPKFHKARNASFETTITIAPGDTTPPWVTNLKPAINETNVLSGSSIKFDVLDDSMGVDPASIKAQVSTQRGIVSYDSSHKFVDYGPKAKGYEVTLVPKMPFFYNDTVTVIIEARDKEPNIMAPFKYRFFLNLDKKAPVLVAIDPRDKQKNVTNTPVFKVFAQDPLAGIDKSSYQLSYHYAGSSEINSIDPQFFAFSSDTITVKPGTVKLEFDTVVVVKASICDLVGNQGNLEYSFRVVKEDTISPSIALVKPPHNLKYDYHPDQLNEFIFSIVDSYAEINTESIKVVISVFSDTTKAPDKSKQFQKESATWNGEKLLFSPTVGNSIQVTCKAQQEPLNITKNQIIRMWIYAEDKFRNHVDSTFEVGTQDDRQEPILLYSIPQHKAQDVSPDTKITLKFTDDPDGDGKNYTGVNLESMRVWMRIIDSNTSFDNDWSKAELIYPGSMNVIEPEPEPKIEMPEKSDKFSVNQIIYLKIYAEDRVQITPNRLDTIIWFHTVKEEADLSIASTDHRIIEKIGDSVRVECAASIKNEFARINSSEVDVSFKLPTGKFVIVPLMGPIEIGSTVAVTLPTVTLFKYGTKIVTVTVDHYNDIPEKDEANNSADISIPGETRIYAEPPVFSPNGDGINDESFIHCDGFDLENPYIKIFDIYSRFIRELTEFSQNPVRFRWDGRDQNGKIVMPGVYLYILYDKGNKLGSGCVVVAY